MSDLNRSGSLARPQPSAPSTPRQPAPPPPHPADVPELRPIFDAIRRGTKRSKLRTLVVVCGNGHTLLEVFPTTAGPWAVWIEADPYIVGRSERPMASPVPAAGEFQTLSDVYGDLWGGACRCAEAKKVRPIELREALDAGKRRVTLDS